MKKLFQTAAIAITMLFAGMANAGNFDGLYVGASVGTDTVSSSLATVTISEKATSLSGYVGYNYMVNETFMLGLEGGILNHTVAKNNNNTTSKDEKFESQYAGVRAGFVMDNMMPYITAGLSKTTLAGTLISTNVRSRFSLSGENYFGVGLEYMFADNFIGRIEYRAENSTYNTLTYKNESISVGISYKF